MDPNSLAQRERHALCDLFLEVGPHAPTLDEGWVAYDLAAHLWVRETDLLAGLGIAIPALDGVQQARIARARRRHTYPDLVERVRRGPGVLSPLREFDAAANTLEFLIHHEDLRRGVTSDVPEREFSAADRGTIMKHLPALARLRLRSRSVRTVLVDAIGGGTVMVGRGSAVDTVTGPPTELALYASGRGRAAHVQVVRTPAGGHLRGGPSRP
ncbi:TIGR03085 family metal-binding protein [Raineyella fluvialis]|uniref:TIGR03085 family metal-binding protein n=1 Tax=Raineyella fluvialis TaxID=2662261 RepID=UPI0018902A68|nr:TIGR03085 family metal-binding protein [Raineyella fluvialis]